MISVENLSFNYPNSSDFAINNLNFSIDRGTIFGFLGPSGSGKSTTQKILYKLLSGYNGRAFIDQKELQNWDKDLYAKIGVSFELPNHYLKLTALENLKFFGQFYSNTLDANELLEKVGLEKDANKKVGEYSKGMKVRLNFVRSILHNPEILFLDEPTSGLDPVNAKIVKDLILEQKQAGKTVFITTHQMHDAEQLCDNVAFIVNGEIKAIDSPSNLKLKHSSHKVEVLFSGETRPREFELKDLGQNAQFLSALAKKQIETIHSMEASLDDVFIKVTGKKLSS